MESRLAAKGRALWRFLALEMVPTMVLRHCFPSESYPLTPPLGQLAFLLTPCIAARCHQPSMHGQEGTHKAGCIFYPKVGKLEAQSGFPAALCLPVPLSHPCSIPQSNLFSFTH